MPHSRVIIIEPLAGHLIVYGQGYYSMHAWRSLAVLAAEQIAARDDARVVVREQPGSAAR